MSHSFCLCRASLLRRRPDESARERSALAVVRVRHLRDRAGPASVDEHTICLHRFPASACPAFLTISWLAYAGRAEQHASRSSVFRTHGSRVQFLNSPDFECLESVSRRIAPEGCPGESRHANSVSSSMTVSKMLLRKTNFPRQVRSFIDRPTRVWRQLRFPPPRPAEASKPPRSSAPAETLRKSPHRPD